MATPAIGLAFAIPIIVVPPIGGAVADRVERIRLLYVTQTDALLAAFVLCSWFWLSVALLV